jgi:hypothetical protein
MIKYITVPDTSGAIYVMSCWYTRREMAFRCALLYTGQTLAFCVAGLIAAGKCYPESWISMLTPSCIRYPRRSKRSSRLAMALHRPSPLWSRSSHCRSLRLAGLSSFQNRVCSLVNDRRYADCGCCSNCRRSSIHLYRQSWSSAGIEDDCF